MPTKYREPPTADATPVSVRRPMKKARAERLPRSPHPTPSIGLLRKDLGINRKLFARLTGYSERAVAKWEAGTKLSGASLQKMTEMRRLQQALITVIRAEFVPQWLQSPSEAFGGLKPIEVVERGEIDRIWQMIFELGSGMPD